MKKKCSFCKRHKNKNQFNKDKTTRDGLRYICKDCNLELVRSWRKRNRDKDRQYQKDYFSSEKGKLAKKRANKKLRAKRPVAIRANAIVNRAVNKGLISKRPCEICQSDDRVQKHHDDYSKPLDVRWLCYLHHKQVHGRLVDYSLLQKTA